MLMHCVEENKVIARGAFLPKRDEVLTVPQMKQSLRAVGKLIHLIPGGSFASVSILDKTALCQDPGLVSQNLFFLLTAAGSSNCTVIFCL